MRGRITRVFDFTFEGQFLLVDLQLSEARDGIFQWPTDQDASMHLPAPKLFGGSRLGDPHGPKCQGALGVPAWERGLPYRQGCIRRQGASEVAPAAGRQAVGGGCQSGWGRLLLVTNAIEAGTWRQGDSGWA